MFRIFELELYNDEYLKWRRNFQIQNVFTFAIDQIEESGFFFFRVDGHELHVIQLAVLMSSKEIGLWKSWSWGRTDG